MSRFCSLAPIFFFCRNFMLDIHTSIIIPDNTYAYENIPYLLLRGRSAFTSVGVDS